jgi:hypothetical protein
VMLPRDLVKGLLSRHRDENQVLHSIAGAIVSTRVFFFQRLRRPRYAARRCSFARTTSREVTPVAGKRMHRFVVYACSRKEVRK